MIVVFQGMQPGYTGVWSADGIHPPFIYLASLQVENSYYGTVTKEICGFEGNFVFENGLMTSWNNVVFLDGVQCGSSAIVSRSDPLQSGPGLAPYYDHYGYSVTTIVSDDGTAISPGAWARVPDWQEPSFYKQVGNTSNRDVCKCVVPTEVGEPITVSNGNVFESAVDYSSASVNTLSFKRYYNSLADPSTLATSLGANWRSNYDRYLRIGYSHEAPSVVIVERPDGQMLTFTWNGVSWVSDSDVDATLVQSGTLWTFTDQTDTVETFTQVSSAKAVVTRIQRRGGYSQSLTYNAKNQLAAVTDMYGRTLTFTYANNMLRSVVTPDKQTFFYHYTPISLYGTATNVLTSVSYPTKPATSINYHYEDADFPVGLTGVTDENGKLFTSWTYDSLGRGLSSQHASGADLTTVTYNDDGSRLVTNALGEQELYRFANLQGVPKVTEIDRQAAGTITAAQQLFTYDANGYLASRTNWNGDVTYITNDARGLPLLVVEASNTSQSRTTQTTWHADFHVPTKVITEGLTTTYGYDAVGDLTGRMEQAGVGKRSWSYQWNKALPVSITGPRTDISQTTQFTYDGLGNLMMVTDALGHVTRVPASTGGGLPLTLVDPNGVTTQLAYDQRLRLIQSAISTSGGTLTTTFTYDPAGNLIKLVRPDRSFVIKTYDPAHRLVLTMDALGDKTAYTLDALDDKTLTTIANGPGAITWQDQAVYDALGRKTAEQRGAGQTTSLMYDNNGNTVAVKDPIGRVVVKTYDPLNRLALMQDPAGGSTSFTYDGHDRLTSVVAPNGAKTSYVRDGFGRVVKRVSPDTGTTLYSYDLADNLVQSKDAAGVVTNYTYDALNRLVSTSYPGDPSENVTRIYDEPGHGFGVGRLTSVVDAVGKLALTYDERGNELSETRVNGGVTLTTAYTYDAASRVASITYPSGLTVTYGHDKAGQVTSISARRLGATASVPIVSGVSYLPFGPAASMSYGNGIAEARSYDQSYRLGSVATGDVQGLSYSYDAADNVTGIADAVQTAASQAFGYDALDRLTTATGGYGSFGWSYDSVGNRTTQSVNGVPTAQYGYKAHSNTLTNIAGSSNPTHVMTSLAGSILAVQPTTGNASAFTYNQAERLAAAQVGTVQASYAYDAFGRRFSKTLSSGQSLFSYGQSRELLEETDGTGALKTDTIYLNGTPVATITPNALFFLHGDKLGTPQIATTTAKAVAWRAAYQPFGTNTGAGGLFAQNFRFPGQYADAETSFSQNGFRDYNPAWGRYLESDPIGLTGGVNTFGYVGANPLRRQDAKGLSFLDPLLKLPIFNRNSYADAIVDAQSDEERTNAINCANLAIKQQQILGEAADAGALTIIPTSVPGTEEYAVDVFIDFLADKIVEVRNKIYGENR